MVEVGVSSVVVEVDDVEVGDVEVEVVLVVSLPTVDEPSTVVGVVEVVEEVELPNGPVLSEVVVELLGDSEVTDGPAAPCLMGAAPPRRADNSAALLPSIPRAQIPTPARFALLANCAASYREVGSSKKVSCHWAPT